ncbi:MAG: hypothetical protein A2231_13170 [Candidatus Firestonebacteria bacterium RIFOXYA2_FULL_40_8]|nr:MAG: hypothetical protein A2231_13170 [Candidatus Firestonebacteria bacterium RIFOXYA2_FULL_40_8]
MKITIFSVSVFLVAICFGLDQNDSGLMQTNLTIVKNPKSQNIDKIQKRYTEINNKINKNLEEIDLDNVKAINFDILSFEDNCKTDKTGEKEQILIREYSHKLLLNYFNIIDKYMNKKYSSENSNFSSNVMPPPGDGISISGMSPNDINDPKRRAEYERLIEENKQRSKKINIQEILIIINENYSERAYKIVKEMSSDLKMKKNTEALIDNIIKDDERKKILLGILEIQEKKEITPERK